MQRRTYWHLEALKRRPTDYEIVSSNLLYHPARGFEVNVPVEDWYRRHQKGSALAIGDPEKFADPRETTYTKYAAIQKDKEIYVDGLLQSIEDSGYDRELTAEWVATLSRGFAPLRFPVHGLQMAAAYVGQMAPGGRITLAAMFQAGDEMRRLQRIAYRTRQLQETHSSFGRDGREVWERDPLWQPMRELVEKLLVTYDWGEALVALNLVVKPMFDEFFMVHLGELAARSGDPSLARILQSLNQDCQWHRDWTRALLRGTLEEKPENQGVLRGWTRRWYPEALRAIAPFGALFGAARDGSVPPGFAAAMSRMQAVCREYWESSKVATTPE